MSDLTRPHANGDMHAKSTSEATVLVVEDDDGVRHMLGCALPLYGFAVRLADSGQEAIEVYNPDEVDIALIDVRMPFMDGVETLHALREINPKILCVFMSGNTARYQPQELLDAGAAAIVVKPFFLAELRKVLLETLEKRKKDASGS